MQFQLKYGRGHVPVEIADSVEVDVIEPSLLPALSDVHDGLLTAVEHPIGSAPLRELIPPEGEVAIVVSDRTRPCAYPAILPLFLDYLNAQGLPDERMFLLVAYGAHRQHTDRENRDFYGEKVMRRLRLFHHDCRDESGLVHVGFTPRGTPVRLNERYLEAAMSVIVAGVGFHYFAGFGGGRKVVFPGLASEQGILRNHRIFVESAEGSLPRIRDFRGKLESNPLHADLMDAAAMAPPTFLVNLCLNCEGNVSRIFAGNWEESHRRACQFLLETRLSLPRRYDLVVASCGGHPKDVNLIQAHKTIDNAFALVRPGGVLLILASCEDGIGSDTFLEWFEHGDLRAMQKALLKKYSMNGGTALALKAKTDACDIHLHSFLESAVVERMGLRPVSNLRRHLTGIIEDRSVKLAAVLPEGAITVAEAESDSPEL